MNKNNYTTLIIITSISILICAIVFLIFPTKYSYQYNYFDDGSLKSYTRQEKQNYTLAGTVFFLSFSSITLLLFLYKKILEKKVSSLHEKNIADNNLMLIDALFETYVSILEDIYTTDTDYLYMELNVERDYEKRFIMEVKYLLLSLTHVKIFEKITHQSLIKRLSVDERIKFNLISNQAFEKAINYTRANQILREFDFNLIAFREIINNYSNKTDVEIKSIFFYKIDGISSKYLVPTENKNKLYADLEKNWFNQISDITNSFHFVLHSSSITED